MWQTRGNRFGCDTHAPEFDDGANRCPRSHHDRLAAQNVVIAHDVAMPSGVRHARLLAWRAVSLMLSLYHTNLSTRSRLLSPPARVGPVARRRGWRGPSPGDG